MAMAMDSKAASRSFLTLGIHSPCVAGSDAVYQALSPNSRMGYDNIISPNLQGWENLLIIPVFLNCLMTFQNFIMHPDLCLHSQPLHLKALIHSLKNYWK